MKKKNILSSIVLLILIIIPIILRKGIIYIPLLFVPIVYEKLFNKKVNEYIKIIYYIYVFLAIYLGGCLKFYKIVNNYDTIVHTIAGFVSALVGFIVADHFKIKNVYLRVLFIFVFSMSIASLWELTEFTMDSLFNQNWQRRETGVLDTMKDMYVHFAGNITFILLYVFDLIKLKGKISDKLLN